MKHKDQRTVLLQWYSTHKRDLPWRKKLPPGSRDPYLVAVSELMLQQTQVQVVIPYFERWINRFPNVQSLAMALEEEVLALWSGLGYYRRAKYLHQMAQVIARDHQGQFPQTPQSILKLPGVGAYTAGAILSLAWNQAEAILDGNLIRVFCRLYAWDQDPAKEPLKSQLWAEARQWVQCSTPGAINEALMELGALVCSPKNPQCSQCPLAHHCQAYAMDQSTAFPKTAKIQSQAWIGQLLWIQKGDRYLLVKQGNNAFGRDYWCPPLMQAPDFAVFKMGTNSPLSQLGQFRHQITKHKIQCETVLLQVQENWRLPSQWGEQFWVSLEDLPKILHFNLAIKAYEFLK